MPGRGGPAAAESAEAVAGAFGRWAGREPEGVWFAPGRVNLIGEHLDYNGGHVLPFAIERGIWLAAARRPDPAVRCYSAQKRRGVEAALPGLRHTSGWGAYLFGAVWSIGEETGSGGGVDLYVDGSLPPGAGLASSAALCCAAALALADLAGISMSRADLARVARRAENEVAGVPTGIMDQRVCLDARAGCALHLDCRSEESEDVALGLDGSGWSLLVADSGVAHRLASNAYGGRRRACEEAAGALGVSFLVEATGEAIGAASLPDDLERVARHVLSEEARTAETVKRLRCGDVGAVGELLTASHRSLQEDFRVSTPELDAIVDTALGAGAAGARLTGGGFGGSVVVLAETEAAGRITRAIYGELRSRHRRPALIEEVRAGAGARRLL